MSEVTLIGGERRQVRVLSTPTALAAHHLSSARHRRQPARRERALASRGDRFGQSRDPARDRNGPHDRATTWATSSWALRRQPGLPARRGDRRRRPRRARRRTSLRQRARRAGATVPRVAPGGHALRSRSTRARTPCRRRPTSTRRIDSLRGTLSRRRQAHRHARLRRDRGREEQRAAVPHGHRGGQRGRS